MFGYDRSPVEQVTLDCDGSEAIRLSATKYATEILDERDDAPTLPVSSN
jgi:hypothetical protein